ncbi:MAG TPA: SRPBCC family protein [Myxococcota bacterium]|nr:SRPBCC family protein [Myxococcota bacterium]
MLKYIAIAVVAAVAAVLIYAATQPGTFRVQRSTTIAAPSEKIFPLINDLHQQQTWSPWEKKDPAMRRIHSGSASGKGAVYEWSGNREIGQGRMEIVESSPPSRVVIAMHFIEPFEAHNTVEFTLEPQGKETLVTWAIYGPRPYCAKLMQLVFDADKMIGREFVAGLASLKALAET